MRLIAHAADFSGLLGGLKALCVAVTPQSCLALGVTGAWPGGQTKLLDFAHGPAEEIAPLHQKWIRTQVDVIPKKTVCDNVQKPRSDDTPHNDPDGHIQSIIWIDADTLGVASKEEHRQQITDGDHREV